MGNLLKEGKESMSHPYLSSKIMGTLRVQVPNKHIINPEKLETGLRTNSAGIPYTLPLRIEAIGFPTFGLLLYTLLNTNLQNYYP